MLDDHGLIAKLTINFCTKSDLQMLLRGKVNHKLVFSALGPMVACHGKGEDFILVSFPFSTFFTSKLNLKLQI